jgi:hypothetical protein
MRVCVEGSSIGTPKSLAINGDGTFEWGENLECDVCVFGSCDTSSVPIGDLVKICGITHEDLSIASNAQIRAFSSLGVDSEQVPWFFALGSDQFKERLSRVSSLVKDITADQEVSRYLSVYRECREFLMSLSRPHIDPIALRQFVAQCDSGLSVIKSIKSLTPGADGLAPKIVYDQAGTATGRLTVKEGPSILTLPKSCRSVIRSSRGGTIWEVDYVSLEPRFVMHVMDRDPPSDIYEDIRQSVFRGEIERSAVKTATISALYGSSADLVSEITGVGSSAKSIIRRVKEYFRADELGDRLTAQVSGGILHNYYGRPLPDMSKGVKAPKLVSYYVQSSCVDTALLGFSKLCDKLKSLDARPIYVIHDAVLIDVPPGAEKEFLNLCGLGIDIDVGHFELKAIKVS